VINIIGLLLFTGMGISLIYPALTQTERVGPWTINVYLGVILILWGFVAFVFDIVKPKTKQEN
jgi:NADH:ubiquinone oxidoreductase subunit 6 (subunit J)